MSGPKETVVIISVIKAYATLVVIQTLSGEL